MGLPGGLLRAFSKGRYSECNQGRSSSEGDATKNKWVHSVKFYLCGNEVNSKLIQRELGDEQESEVSASCKSSDTNLISKQTLATDSSNNEVRMEFNEDRNQDQDGLQEKSLREEKAAIAIQSAYKGFMARRQFKKTREADQQQEEEEEEEEGKDISDLYENTDAATVATSTEVQLGESFSTIKLSEESVSLHSKGFSKGRPPVFKAKEEWDDSTVSSNVSKMRIQNRLEATTRRERALAYAFSQQLRTCNSKKRSSRCDSTEPNVSWSWLERWMATRANPESDNMQPDDCISKTMGEFYNTTSRKTILIKNRRLDVSFEGKESCGSNDVSVNFEGFSAKSQSSTASECNRIIKNKPKASASKSIPRRKVLSESRCNSRSNKVIKREHSKQEKSSNLHDDKDSDTSQPSVEC
ncbi:Protein IQ-DOMAIN 1 [Rhynchospora pubera]|uniref:Protein IQ-DOMAIN 1 n=1 Tax=Rhynchospora pubera TaxID=906938 RepID=A0AAV8G664_9POAL|nr:Protein IQ-DOMAIN 1 [Rhynchospora pubera]